MFAILDQRFIQQLVSEDNVADFLQCGNPLVGIFQRFADRDHRKSVISMY